MAKKSFINETATDLVGDQIKKVAYKKTAEGISDIRIRLDEVNDDGSYGSELSQNVSQGLGITQKGLEYLSDPNELKEDILPIVNNIQNNMYLNSSQSFFEGNALTGTLQESVAESIEGVKTGTKLVINPSEGLQDVGSHINQFGQDLTDYSKNGNGFTNYLANDLGAGAKNISSIVNKAGEWIETKGDELAVSLNTIKETAVDATVEAKDAGIFIVDSLVGDVTNLGKELVDATVEAKDAGIFIKDNLYSLVSQSIVKNLILDDNTDETILGKITQDDVVSVMLSFNSYEEIDKFKLENWERVGEFHSPLGTDIVANYNSEKDEIVFAYAGTADMGDIASDLLLAFGFMPESQINENIKFINKIKKLYPTAKVTHAGHSWGGFQAEVMARIDGTKAVTVESPGLTDHQMSQISRFQPGDLVCKVAEIRNINNNSGVNSIGKHRGTAINLGPTDLNSVKGKYARGATIDGVFMSIYNGSIRETIKSVPTLHVEGSVLRNLSYNYANQIAADALLISKPLHISSVIVDLSKNLEARSSSFGHGWLSLGQTGSGGGGGGTW